MKTVGPRGNTAYLDHISIIGERNRSGIAVLDAGGDLVFVDAAVSDAGIQAELTPHVEGPCHVAIDAPLVVNNLTGMPSRTRSVAPWCVTAPAA
jgi:predicted RNase H-like nuclease